MSRSSSSAIGRTTGRLPVKSWGRSWRRNPGTPILIVGVLALGIGLAGAAFSVAWGTLWRGMEHIEGEALVDLSVELPGSTRPSRLPEEVVRAGFEGEIESLESFGAWEQIFVFFEGPGPNSYPETVRGAAVSVSVFEILGVTPLHGRLFGRGEARSSAPVVVVSERLCREHLGAPDSALGAAVEIDGELRTIVGVVEEGLEAPYDQELWIPLQPQAVASSRWLRSLGALRDGATRESLAAELAPRIQAHEADSRGRPVVTSFQEGSLGWVLRNSLLLALVAALAIFAVACANAAGLWLARGLEKRREIAIRHALGASRANIFASLLAEAALLVALAGGLGVAVAAAAVDLYNRTLSLSLPFWVDVRIDAAVLLFVLLASAGSLGCAAVLPCWRATSEGCGLRSGRSVAGERGAAKWRGALIVFQVALATGLVAGSFWMLAAVERLSRPTEGLRHEDVAGIRVSIDGTAIRGQALAEQSFYRALKEDLEALPEVEAAAYGPLPGGWSRHGDVEIGSSPEVVRAVRTPVLTAGALGILKQDLVLGRDLLPSEASALDVALVDRRFADAFLDGNPLGQRVRVQGEESWRRIVGVTPNMAFDPLGEPEASVYLPALSQPGPTKSLVLGLRGTLSADLDRAIRRTTASAESGAMLFFVRTTPQVLEAELRHVRRMRRTLQVFSGVALMISFGGLYGLLALAVVQRRRELAIRQALGATAGGIGRSVVRSGLRKILVGVSAGGLAALWAHEVLTSLFGRLVMAGEIGPPTLLMLLIAGLAAAVVPALKASRISPSVIFDDE
ncbi:MAG: ABC transporter permease [Acidobacteriota bacterium]